MCPLLMVLQLMSLIHVVLLLSWIPVMAGVLQTERHCHELFAFFLPRTALAACVLPMSIAVHSTHSAVCWLMCMSLHAGAHQ